MLPYNTGFGVAEESDPGKEFVRAVTDYVTKEPNLLSFKRGDLIEIIRNPSLNIDKAGSAVLDVIVNQNQSDGSPNEHGQENGGDDEENGGNDNKKDKKNDGWLFGRFGGRIGHFPREYVTPLADPSQDFSPNNTTSQLGWEHSSFEYNSGGQNSYQNKGNNQRHSPPLIEEEMMEDKWKGIENGNGGKLTMMEFAMMYFRHAPQSSAANAANQQNHKSDKKNKKDKEWTWREIADQVKYSRQPLQDSLLRLESNEFNKMALEAFTAIQRYMGDIPLSKKNHSLTDCVYEIMLICHRFPPMRDEIYCQIVKQTTNNKSNRPDSPIKGWRLFSILTSYFDCSQVLKPYLLKYLNDAAGDTRRAYHGTALVCLQNAKKTFKYGGRKVLLAAKEIEAITHGKNLKRQLYHMPGGHKKVVNTKSVTVVQEIVQELCNELNIRSHTEQQEFCLCHIIESENVMKLLGNDEYILDVTTELEGKGKDYFLLLKRTVWMQPLRLDNHLYIDVMFFQLVPDYLEGLLVIMSSVDNLSAATMDAIAKLAALLYKSDDEWRGQQVDGRNVNQLVPRIVANVHHISLDQWAERVNSKLSNLPSTMTPIEARAAFLQVLQDWPLFGSTFFFIQNVSDPTVKGESLLSINKHGIQFLHIITHKTLLEFGLTDILSTHKVTTTPPGGGQPMQFLDLKVGNANHQDVITLQTEQGSEISRLLGQYIFVDSQNRNYITNNSGGNNNINTASSQH